MTITFPDSLTVYADYTATVTCDAMNNITEIDEEIDNSGHINHFYSYMSYDKRNRLSDFRNKKYDSLYKKWLNKKRTFTYSANNELGQTNLKSWVEGLSEPSGDDVEHVWSQRGQHVQDKYSSIYGVVSHHAGSQHSM